MQFNPPYISNISDVLPHIENNPAFGVHNKGWYISIDYHYAHRDTFDNEYARECRGLKFCSTTGNILARPYGKFHNFGECKGWFAEDIDLNQPHVILDKLDGSMVHTVIDPQGKLRLMTRMGESTQALDALAFCTQVNYGISLRDLALENPTKTFIFEYVGPNNRIVIPYEKEELILTGIRDIFTGEYTTYMGMKAYLDRFRDIPLVQTYGDTGSGTIDEFYDFAVRNDNISEGCIVRFDTGAMVKMKSEIYVRKHKSKELTETLKGVVQVIVDDTLDDILPQVEDKVREKLIDYKGHLLNRVNFIHEGLRHILSSSKDMEQKEFALHIQETYPAITCRLLFATRKSGDGFTEIMNTIKRRYNKEADLEELFENLELPVWQ